MKIDREKIAEINEAVEWRIAMRTAIRENYSNPALAARFGVNVRTIEKYAALCRPDQKTNTRGFE